MNKLRIIPVVLGIALLVSTLVGAKRLLHNEPGTPTGGGPPAPEPPAPAAGALVAKGTVASDPGIIAYTLPAHLQAGTVVKVEVVSGQMVKPNDVLVKFDDTLLQLDRKKALEMYNTAFQDYNAALEKHKNHPMLISRAKLAETDALQQQAHAKEQLEVTERLIEQGLDALRIDGAPLTKEDKDRRKKDDPRYIVAKNAVERAELPIAKAKLDLEEAEKAEESLNTLVRKAAHAATAIKNEMDRIDQAIADCVLRAKVAGTVELVNATEGQVVYPQTRPPLLYLVPGGKRIVMAEVVPDFAHLLKDRVGQRVEITDDNKQDYKYYGTIRRIGSAFLPKASAAAADLINGKSTAVLMVEIEVTDPNPPKQPPLRVGQPVRVTIP